MRPPDAERPGPHSPVATDRLASKLAGMDGTPTPPTVIVDAGDVLVLDPVSTNVDTTTVRQVLTDAADRCATGDRPSACTHGAGVKFLCDRHPGLGPLCGRCSSAHDVRRHDHEPSRCPSCSRPGRRLVVVLLAISDGRFVSGLAFCSACLLAATANGQRLAS